VNDVGHGVPDPAILDCSAGINPYGAPPAVVAALATITADDVSNYPGGNSLERAVAAYLGGGVTERNVVLTFGAMEGIFRINAAFAGGHGAFAAFAPHFPDASISARLLGMRYESVPMDDVHNFAVDPQQMAERIGKEWGLVYIDNPNNPTGQIVTPDELRPVLDRARSLGVCVLVDEAYGDYAPIEYSCAPMINEYDNLIVTRSLSKGFGLAGLRVGYIVASEDLCAIFEMLGNPYVGTTPARILGCAALENSGALRASSDAIAASKARIRDALPPHIKMAETYLATSICLLYHSDRSVDLRAAFADHGITVYSGSSFDGLDVNSVRLRIPHERDVERVIAAVQAIGA